MSFKSRKILIVFLAQADKPPNIRLDEDVLKRSLRHLDQDDYIGLSNTSSRRLQNVFRTFPRRLQDVLQKRLQDIFKIGHLQDVLPRHLEGVFKTSSRRLTQMSSRHLLDVFKTYHQIKLFLQVHI